MKKAVGKENCFLDRTIESRHHFSCQSFQPAFKHLWDSDSQNRDQYSRFCGYLLVILHNFGAFAFFGLYLGNFRRLEPLGAFWSL